MSEPLVIVIGLRKAGTSWLHRLAAGDDVDKEICFPKRRFAPWVYDRYVAGRTLLVWPYLVHEPARLARLIRELVARGRTFRLVLLTRPKDDWVGSMARFLVKHGVDEERAQEQAVREWDRVERTLAALDARHDIERLSLFGGGEKRIDRIASLLGRPRETIASALGTRVYASDEVGRVPTGHLVNAFFMLKPFLPRSLRHVTKNSLLRRLFFRRREASVS